MEWRNDRGKNRTRNRGNIITECKIGGIGGMIEAAYVTGAEYNVQTI